MFKRLLIILLSICIYFNSALADKLNEIIVKGNERISNETIILFSGIKLNDDIDTNILNDVIKNYFNNICPSYISIDTEGSEYEILKSFDLDNFRPKLFTIEHNFTENESKIDEYLANNNYVRIFKKLTAFDAWYIPLELL